MDNKLVEAVARAICKANGDHWFASDNLTKHNAQHWKLAQAALAATPLASLKAENEALREALVGIERIAEKNTGISGARSLQAAMHAIFHTARAALTKQGG